VIRKAMRQAGLDDSRLASREVGGALPVQLGVDGYENQYDSRIGGWLGRSTWPELRIGANASRFAPSGP